MNPMQGSRLSPFSIMDDDQLLAALRDLETKAAQLDYLREPPPATIRASIEDDLHRARAEAERRRI